MPDNTKPGVFVQNFIRTRFTVIVEFSIVNAKYWNDVPILIEPQNPIFSPGNIDIPEINLGSGFVSTEDLSLAGEDNFNQQVHANLDLAENLIQEMEDVFNAIEENPDCPDAFSLNPEIDPIEINILDQSNEIISTITSDLSERSSTKCTVNSNEKQVASFLSNLPDVGELEANLRTICLLPDGATKEKLIKLSTGVNSIIDTTEAKSLEIKTSIETSLLKLKGLDPSGTLTSNMDSLENYLKEKELEYLAIGANKKQWYGIPMIELVQGIKPDSSDSIILQLDTKNNKIGVLNLGSLLNTPENHLEFDFTPEIGIKYSLGLSTNRNQVTIFLWSIQDGLIGEKTIRTNQPLSLNSFGTDTRQIKTFCGVIHNINVYDVQSIPEAITIIEKNIQLNKPNGSLAFYDFHKSRVILNIVHEKYSTNKPLQIRGIKELDWSLFSDEISPQWKFMENGSIENFFCRKNFLDSSFGIVFNFMIPDEKTTRRGLETIISDDINANYLEYHWEDLRFILSIGSNKYYWDYAILNDLWYQFHFGFELNKDQLSEYGKFSLDITEHQNDTTNSIEFETDSFRFELMTMLAKYNSKKKLHENKFGCSFGQLVLFDNSINKDQLDSMHQEHKLVIGRFNHDNV